MAVHVPACEKLKQALPVIMALAALCAAVEILLGFGPGHFMVRARAEPDAFLTYRPWLVAALSTISAWYFARPHGASVPSLWQAYRHVLLTTALYLLIATVSAALVTGLVGAVDVETALRGLLAALIWALAAAFIACGFFVFLDRGWIGLIACACFFVGSLALKPPLPSIVQWMEAATRPLDRGLVRSHVETHYTRENSRHIEAAGLKKHDAAADFSVQKNSVGDGGRHDSGTERRIKRERSEAAGAVAIVSSGPDPDPDPDPDTDTGLATGVGTGAKNGERVGAHIKAVRGASRIEGVRSEEPRIDRKADAGVSASSASKRLAGRTSGLAIGVMTDLPLFWGSGPEAASLLPDQAGADDQGLTSADMAQQFLEGAANRAAVQQILAAQFQLKPLDVLNEAALERLDVLMLAQPRVLHARELVLLDEWVRRGGAVLVLADPSLRWAEHLRTMGGRAPAARSFLQPLLSHWGVSLDVGEHGLRILHSDAHELFGAGRVIFEDVGALKVEPAACRAMSSGLMASCAIGAGKVFVIADADFLQDENWMGPGSLGMGRHGRIADNPYFLVGVLQNLAGVTTVDTAFEKVRWASLPQPSPILLTGLGLVIPTVFLALSVILVRRRKVFQNS